MPFITSFHGGLARSLARSTGEETRAVAENKDYAFLFEAAAAKDANLRPPAPSLSAEQAHENYITVLNRLASYTSQFGEAIDDATQDSSMPAAYTYLGQFIDHDITAPIIKPKEPSDEASGEIIELFSPDHGLEELVGSIPPNPQSVLRAIQNQHERPLFLDSLYAKPDFTLPPDEPGDHSLYDPPVFKTEKASTFNPDNEPPPVPVKDAIDFPRRLQIDRLPGGATKKTIVSCIADHRNDDNLILAQLHLLFMQFHNRVVQDVKSRKPRLSAPEVFEEARRTVTHHYHKCIVEDFLPRILDGKILKISLDRTKSPGTTLVNEEMNVWLEFTTAAYRFGHSLVRPAYDYNENFGVRKNNPATIDQLFKFTSVGGLHIKDHPRPDSELPQLPNQWTADWSRLCSKLGATTNARLIDTRLTHGMNSLDLLDKLPKKYPGNLKVMIAVRNLMRGYYRRIPCGQVICGEIEKILGVNIPQLSPADVANIVKSELGEEAVGFLEKNHLHSHTPAWFYFLCEAKHFGSGERLGPAASFIVAETILGLIARYKAIVAKTGWESSDSLKIPQEGPEFSLWDIVRYVKPPGTRLTDDLITGPGSSMATPQPAAMV